MLAGSRSGPQPVPASARPSDGGSDHLETWKEIAAYLRRDVRTAKRWERTRGLPVHRLPGGPKAAVYAIRAELERWREGAHLDLSEESEPGARAASKTAWWLAGLAVALAAAGIVLWYLAMGPAKSPPHVAPLTSYQGVEWFPAVSPDSKLVAFSWNGAHQNNYDLYVKVINTGNPLRLTADPDMDIAPAWSPDGRSIGFIRWRLGAPAYRYLVMPALGGAERVITSGHITANAIGLPFPVFSWTPDGSRLIVAEPQGSSESYALSLVSVATAEVRRLTEPPLTSPGDCCPVVSPDGRMVAFLRASYGRQRKPFVLEISRNGEPAGAPRPLDGPACMNPFWAGDGSEVLCITGDLVDRRLWRMPVTRGWGRAREVPSYLGLPGQQFSARGHTVIYSSFSWEQVIWERSNGSGNADRRIGASAGEDSAPDVSPDGNRIAFVSTRSGRLAVWVCGRDGANATEVAVAAAPQTPRWSPGGETIAYTCRSGDGPEQICTVEANGGRQRQVTRKQARHLLPSWSRDGKWIYYSSDLTGTFQIWKMPLDASAPPSRITRDGGFGGIESADGRTLLYTRAPLSGPIYRVPVAGGDEVPLGEGVRSLRLPVNFAVGAGAVFFAWSENPLLGFEIRSYSLGDGKIRTLQRIGRGLGNGMTLSPDERSILFTSMELNSGDLFVIDNAP